MNALLGFDRFSRHAPLGFAFRDASDLSLIGDGLVVTVTDQAIPARTAQLAATASGYWTAPRLPGLGIDLAGRPLAWPAASRPFVVTVEDSLRRFLPVRFVAALPNRGLFHWPRWDTLNAARVRPILPQPTPAGLAPAYVPLFPSIARTPPGPRAIVRAAIAERQADGTDKPASWAVVTVQIGNRVVGLGLADATGAVAVCFAYPALPLQTAAQAAAGRPDVIWSATIRVYWSELADPLPDLADILGQLNGTSRNALARLTAANPTLPAQSLVLGRPLVLRTQRPAPNTDNFSSLYLQAA